MDRKPLPPTGEIDVLVYMRPNESYALQRVIKAWSARSRASAAKECVDFCARIFDAGVASQVLQMVQDYERAASLSGNRYRRVR